MVALRKTTRLQVARSTTRLNYASSIFESDGASWMQRRSSSGMEVSDREANSLASAHETGSRDLWLGVIFSDVSTT